MGDFDAPPQYDDIFKEIRDRLYTERGTVSLSFGFYRIDGDPDLDNPDLIYRCVITAMAPAADASHVWIMEEHRSAAECLRRSLSRLAWQQAQASALTEPTEEPAEVPF